MMNKSYNRIFLCGLLLFISAPLIASKDGNEQKSSDNLPQKNIKDAQETGCGYIIYAAFGRLKSLFTPHTLEEDESDWWLEELKANNEYFNEQSWFDFPRKKKD